MNSSGFAGFDASADVERATEECLEEIKSIRFVERLWAHDTGLWPGNEAETAERLGWLHVGDTMSRHLAHIKGVRDELLRDGYTDAVLLGMGGSSLGAEVIDLVLGQGSGLRLHVLDSIVPSAVARVRDDTDLKRTVFIVASKSGGTLEPNLLYEYFRSLVDEHAADRTGAHFIAITDAESSLHKLALELGFRAVFLNPTDIGGRYSVLSLFGLVPGVLAGADIDGLHDSGVRMGQACQPGATHESNPGVALAAYLAGCIRAGRDKLTILQSPMLRSFGWWAEQLIAESTGKQGTGILPVVDEPLLSPDAYSADRAFVYMRYADDANTETDEHVRAVTASGHPCVTIELDDATNVGGEFFRWEYATACAGALMGINPFDQPNVQSAKDAGKRVLAHYLEQGVLPEAVPTVDLESLISDVVPGTYLAVMAYVCRRDEIDEVVEQFRRRIADKTGIATTFGYGPRFLHSTGQLHKGGPPTGRFLQIVAAHTSDIPLPKQPYTFGVAADAQALGDMEALKELGRPVARITLEKDDAAQMKQVLRRVG